MRTISRQSKRGLRLNAAAILFAPLGVAVILLAQLIDGASIGALLQGSAALIVLGGTLGAILITYSPGEVLRAGRAALMTFVDTQEDVRALSDRLMALAVRAHRRGIVALENDVAAIPEPFLRGALTLAVDETSTSSLRETLMLEAAARERDEEAAARIFDAAAGYAPTLGILGAVLGLVRAMEHLTAPGAVGSGIAVAFIATIYGVGIANLVLLPMAGRLRERSLAGARRRELIVHAVCAIHQRVHPRLVAQTLRALSSEPIADPTVRLAASEAQARVFA